MSTKNIAKMTMRLDPDLWNQVRHIAIDRGISATEYVNQAIKEKIGRGVKK